MTCMPLNGTLMMHLPYMLVLRATEQKLNTKRSIENEFVGADYISTMIL